MQQDFKNTVRVYLTHTEFMMMEINKGIIEGYSGFGLWLWGGTCGFKSCQDKLVCTAVRKCVFSFLLR